MSRTHNETLESIKYSKGSLRLLDQRRLPLETVFDDIRTIDDIYTAIKEMRVRGAPAIAVSAALGIAVAAERKRSENVFATAAEAKTFLLSSCDTLADARPTAVNLSNTLRQFQHDIAAIPADTAEGVVAAAVSLAESIHDADVSFNVGIMQHGASHITRAMPQTEKVRLLTICNTGALATARYGTALGVVRQLFYSDRLERLFACETRPWNQGARLTVYECVREEMPCTLLCDSAAAALMRAQTIHAVVVGADRVCQNGDTANKIGTYQLAVAAKYHGVPFYVAAPSTTLDPHTPNGAGVTIEERDAMELTHNIATKERVVAEGPRLSVWNPVFDITPGALITGGIITERGVFEPSQSAPHFDIARILNA